jgi:hypothetical protein
MGGPLHQHVGTDGQEDKAEDEQGEGQEVHGDSR